MGSFQDIRGQSWTIEPLTIGTVLRVKRDSAGKFDLLEPTKPMAGSDRGLYESLQFDVLEFWELLAHLVAPQISERSTTADAFGSVMAGEGLLAARDLFFDEWSRFFLHLRRPDLATALDKAARYSRKAVEVMTARIQASPELEAIDKAIEEKVNATLSESFGSLQESLELIQGHSASANSAG